MLRSRTTLPHTALTLLLASPLSCAPADQEGEVSDPQGCRTVILPADSTSGADQAWTSSGSSDAVDGSTTTGGDTNTGTTTSEPSSTSTGADTCSIFGCGTTGQTDGACDIWAQDCPEGEKCSAWANDGGGTWNANKCVPVDPNPKQLGEACTTQGSGASGLDDCDEGMMCWDIEQGVGHCVEFCTGSPDAPLCSDPKAFCAISNDGVLPLCIPSCDPLLQDCLAGEACIPYNGGFLCALDASGDTGVDGDPCEYENACDPGLFCADGDLVPDCQTPGCCASFCDLILPNSCPLKALGAECLPFYPMGTEPPGKENLGACTLPG